MNTGKGSKKSILETIAAFIVDKRKAVYLLYVVLLVFSIFSSGWVKVNNDLTDYLDKNTETRRGLSLMKEQFTTYATAEIMVDNISFADAESLKTELEQTDGVKEIVFDETDKHYSDMAALFSVTFNGDADDPVCEKALSELSDAVSDYDTYISAELGDTKAKTIAKEILIVMIIVSFIVLGVLLLTSRTYMEVPVLIITFLSAALINKGTNYLFGTISFVSDSVAIVLQLALAIDYAIILCNRYTEERASKDARSAIITALQKAVPEISGSCLTTLAGLAAMTFMHFKIGFDMGIVLIKSILISIIVVFTLMPGLILSMSPLIDKTHHKSFIPEINAWCKIILKLRIVAPCIFAGLLILGFVLSNRCPYAFSTTEISTITKNSSQIAQEMINQTFKTDNTLAVVIPAGDYKKEQQLAAELENYSQIASVTALASSEATDGYSVGDRLRPRQFAELVDMDIEKVELLYAAYASENDELAKIIGGIESYDVTLIDLFEFIFEQSENLDLDEETQDKLNDLDASLTDGKNQLEGEKYSRLVLDLNLPEESPETFEFLKEIRKTAKKYYPEVLLVGNSTNNYDLSSTFDRDNMLIAVLSIIFVLLVLLFTFQSVSIPFILILVIQGSIWLNFSFPTVEQKPIFFLSYLVVSAIQMGANIDYAIVITNRYTELRRDMSPEDAIVKTLNLSFPTIFTSGTILASAGFMVGIMSSEPSIASLGLTLGRGTLISIVLVMGILPQLLLFFDKIMDKTSFESPFPSKTQKKTGTIFVNGQLHGHINGRVDGTFTGRISGDVDANITSKDKEDSGNV